MNKKVKLYLGNNIESIKKLPDNSIDSVVTDPPYGLSFMSKKWDYDVPSVEFWKEVLRVLKPGGHVLSFGGTRTYHRMVVNIEDAGFEIRDQVMWLYGVGFPKSHNIGKAVDKIEGNEREVVGSWTPQGTAHRMKGSSIFPNENIEDDGSKVINDINLPITKGTSQYEGWGTALKPANEPICVARKPLSEKTIADNVIKWGTGGINIDGCRIKTTDTYNYKNGPQGNSFSVGKEPDGKRTEPVEMNSEGRFPANIILDEEAAEFLDEQSGESKSSIFPKTNKPIFNTENGWNSNSIEGGTGGGYNDKGGASRFFYVAKSNEEGRFPANIILDEEAAELLDEQSGISKSSKGKERKVNNIGSFGGGTTNENNEYNDKGGASRFFYQAKVSKKERNLGLDGFEEVDESKNKAFDVEGGRKSDMAVTKNTHPTLKPINLMTYLCRLVTPVGGIVLDPFMGSGSTGIAALLEGFKFCGMEMDADYMKIAEARIESYEEYRKLLKK